MWIRLVGAYIYDLTSIRRRSTPIRLSFDVDTYSNHVDSKSSHSCNHRRIDVIPRDGDADGRTADGGTEINIALRNVW